MYKKIIECGMCQANSGFPEKNIKKGNYYAYTIFGSGLYRIELAFSILMETGKEVFDKNFTKCDINEE